MVLALSISHTLGATSTCTPKQFRDVKNTIRARILASPARDRWPARLLRAGLHDCLPQSCDGSIEFELTRSENFGIEPTISFLKAAINGTCSSLADALKLGMELSTELTRGPKFKCRRGITTVAEGPNPKGRIPFAFEDFDTIIRKFTDMGFTRNEALAGNFGGHSLGQFGPFTFDSTPAKLDRAFVKFVAAGRAPQNATASRFNVLPSDTALFEGARKRVTKLAVNKRLFRRDFRRFMVKLCAL